MTLGLEERQKSDECLAFVPQMSHITTVGLSSLTAYPRAGSQSVWCGGTGD